MNKVTKRTEVEAVVKLIVINQNGLSSSEYDATASLFTLGSDSLDALEIGMELEDQLGVELDDALIVDDITPQILIDAICNILKIT